MASDMTPQKIKEIRGRYGLSQKAFARLLGLGDASIVRYENGQEPSKANANLIRAAFIPEFMADCLERDGGQLPEAQREQVEKVVYAEVALGKEGEMGINEIYELTLQQEVLNEKAWGVMARLSRARIEAKRGGDEALALVYEDMELQIARITARIIAPEYDSKEGLARLKGQLEGVTSLFDSCFAKAA